MKLASPYFSISTTIGFLVVIGLCCCAPLTLQATQVQKLESADDPFGEQIEESAIEPETTEAQDDTPLPPPPVKEISEKFVRFHMWDGSIVGGEVQMETISVETEFGVLQVPIRDIRKFYPGLNSFPELDTKIKNLVEKLGDKDFDVREKSHRELTGMGIQIRNELDKFEDGGSAERKKRISEIKKEFDEQLDSMDEDDDSTEQPLIRGDRIDTPNFSIVGKIQQEEFVLDSKFGELRVTLGDVQMADRSFQEVGGVVKKKFNVSGHTFFQKKPLSTKLRINKGDRISVKADGVIQWTNWSTSSSPEGLTNQGKYLGINGGTLICRVGTSGQPMKVGSKVSFVAKKSGVLYFAIAMQDSYINNSGYRWVGNYKAQVEVKPAGTK